MEAEIFVVDNASSDDTPASLQPLFPSVHFIACTENLGFARANNIARQQCSGSYVLFLNPDTLVPADALQKCLAYLRSHPRAGALGVRMLDGRGRFLPESKRAFPSPWVSFCKLCGLAALFPHSGIFNRYALGHLSDREDHVVEVLAGAFMLVKKKLLNELNGFDENYFLYGEDIDLSYRIRKAGYENHYFAGTAILHFKGESSAQTRRNRDRYFYQAMRIFVAKHYQETTGKLFSLFLNAGIGLRGFLSAASRFLQPLFLPLLDILLVWLSLQAARFVWIVELRRGKDFGVDAIPVLLPVFAACFVTAASFMGLYERNYRMSRILSSLAFGLISLLAVYALLPEHLRFSRGVIVCGGLLGVCILSLLRPAFLRGTGFYANSDEAPDAQTVVVASAENYRVISALLLADMSGAQLLGRISSGEEKDSGALCTLEELPAFAARHTISRIIYCVDDIDWYTLLTQLGCFGKKAPLFLFHTAGSHSIISSQAGGIAARMVTPDRYYALASPYQQKMKRLLDLFTAAVFLLFFPFHGLFHPHPIALLKQSCRVLAGTKTWIGYSVQTPALPSLAPAVINAAGEKTGHAKKQEQEEADRFYARHYDWWNDLAILLRHYRCLG